MLLLEAPFFQGTPHRVTRSQSLLVWSVTLGQFFYSTSTIGIGFPISEIDRRALECLNSEPHQNSTCVLDYNSRKWSSQILLWDELFARMEMNSVVRSFSRSRTPKLCLNFCIPNQKSRDLDDRTPSLPWAPNMLKNRMSALCAVFC